MANQEQLNLLKQGVDIWNQWRTENPSVKPDLFNADLSGADLKEAYLSQTDLRGANLLMADLRGANLNKADLSQADLSRVSPIGESRGKYFSRPHLVTTNLSGASLVDATLRGAKLREVTLTRANLNRADLSQADLSGANLRYADLNQANLTGCRIYAISAWDIQLEETIQSNLIITPFGEPDITVDNLEVAQFIYLLLNNKKIRDIIDTITSKVVLILGRFTPERNAILDAIRDELRKHNYSPVLFDFDKPASQTMAETISTLAHLARFILVDITDPRSVPAELATIVPHCLVPVQPLLEVPSAVIEEKVTGKHVVEESTVKGKDYALFRSLQLYPWVLPIVHYQDTVELLTSLKERVIGPAEQKAKELSRQK